MREILKFVYAIILFQQAIFMVLLLFKKKLRNRQQWLIFLILMSFFLCGLDRVINIYSAFFSRKFPSSVFILDTFNLLYLPLIYLFVKSFALKRLKLFWFEFIHFAPFVYSFLLVLIEYTAKTPENQYLILQSFNHPGYFFTNSFNYKLIGVFRTFQIVYIVVSLLYLQSYRLKLKDKTAKSSEPIMILFGVLISFIALWLINLFFKSTIEKHFIPIVDLLIITSSAIFIYFGFKMPEEFLTDKSASENIEEERKIKDFEPYKKILETKMESEKLYINPEITLKLLSENTSIPSRILSETINNCYQMHFFDYINSLRIEEAKKILKETDKTVLEILYHVGFNSKSAFNRAFQKHTQTTPSLFRRMNQGEKKSLSVN